MTLDEIRAELTNYITAGKVVGHSMRGEGLNGDGVILLTDDTTVEFVLSGGVITVDGVTKATVADALGFGDD